MSSKQTSYRSIFKATSIFGGVQVFNILVTLIRGKATAVLIGTAGMGLNGLLLSGLKLITSLTSLGISSSAVRDLSIAFGESDTNRFETTYTVFRNWIWFTAGLGVLSSILFAPLLSQFAFGNDSYTSAYIWLSSTFIFGALSGGIYTVLRAVRKINYLAQANIYGSVAGLLVTLPILYFWRIDGVMPAIIAASAVTYLISIYFRKKVDVKLLNLSLKETFNLGKPMVIMGINMSLSSVLASVSAFILSAFITNQGSLSDLGLYSAGMSIMGGYIGMVFTAIGTDYFPRLSAVINDKEKWQEVVHHQAELVLIILSIVLTLLVVTSPILIRVLLSKEFLDTRNFIIISSLSIPLKGLVWVLGFVVLSKGDNRLFFITELLANSWFLVFNLLFYYYYSIDGLAISMVLSYFISILMMLFVMKRFYNFYLEKDIFLLLIKGILPLVALVLIYIFIEGFLQIGLLVLISLLTLIYQFYELNKRLDIVEFIKSKIVNK